MQKGNIITIFIEKNLGCGLSTPGVGLKLLRVVCVHSKLTRFFKMSPARTRLYAPILHIVHRKGSS